MKLASEIGAPATSGATVPANFAIPLKSWKRTIILGDLKHHAASVQEKGTGGGERFQSFVSEVGLTCNRVQQTELDKSPPPTLKSKSRFMNVEELFECALMVLSMERQHSKGGFTRLTP